MLHRPICVIFSHRCQCIMRHSWNFWKGRCGDPIWMLLLDLLAIEFCHWHCGHNHDNLQNKDWQAQNLLSVSTKFNLSVSIYSSSPWNLRRNLRLLSFHSIGSQGDWFLMSAPFFLQVQFWALIARSYRGLSTRFAAFASLTAQVLSKSESSMSSDINNPTCMKANAKVP